MDERPPVWVGHAVLQVTDLDRASEFWAGIGLREVGRDERVAVLEFRGGTHLVLLRGPNPPAADSSAPFDLMVDDLDATRAEWEARGLEPSVITRGTIHDTFTVRDPDDRLATVNNSHVVGPV